MVSKINGKAFHQTTFFLSITEENEKDFIVKYTPKVHNFMVVPKYETQFLHINLKLIHLLQIFQFVVVSLISILVGILWSSESFLKYTVQNFLKIHK